MSLKHSHYFFVFASILLLSACSARSDRPPLLEEWERGFVVAAREDPEMRVFLWFYEWHMFDALLPGIHTHASGNFKDWSEFNRSMNESHSAGYMEKEEMRLDLRSVKGGAEMVLTIRNITGHDWPDLAAMIPCFNPGPPPGRYPDIPFSRNESFADADSTHTWFVGPGDLNLLSNRSIHFNNDLRPQVDAVRADSGSFVFDGKWPTSPVNAYEGLIVRESLDGEWVAGIAWEDFLSSQGHNPWLCMHLAVRVGPLQRGMEKKIKGKIYLFKGTREDCLRRYRADFKVK